MVGGETEGSSERGGIDVGDTSSGGAGRRGSKTVDVGASVRAPDVGIAVVGFSDVGTTLVGLSDVGRLHVGSSDVGGSFAKVSDLPASSIDTGCS
jgi:hypothetical protein